MAGEFDRLLIFSCCLLLLRHSGLYSLRYRVHDVAEKPLVALEADLSLQLFLFLRGLG